MLNEGNQIHNFISGSGSGSDFLTSYGSGSTKQKDTVPTVPVPVPVPQHWFYPQHNYLKHSTVNNEGATPFYVFLSTYVVKNATFILISCHGYAS